MESPGRSRVMRSMRIRLNTCRTLPLTIPNFTEDHPSIFRSMLMEAEERPTTARDSLGCSSSRLLLAFFSVARRTGCFCGLRLQTSRLSKRLELQPHAVLVPAHPFSCFPPSSARRSGSTCASCRSCSRWRSWSGAIPVGCRGARGDAR